MIKNFLTILLNFLIVIFSSCQNQKSPEFKDKKSLDNKIQIAIPNDIDFFNPLYSNDVYSGIINDLIFSSLTYSEFDTDSGKLIYYPNLAKKWDIKNDHKSILFILKMNLRWNDGTPFTSEDVKYSYILYTHPDVMSVRQDFERYFIHNSDGMIDFNKSFVVLNDSMIQFNFNESVEDPLFITGLPILPKHIFKNIPLNKIFYSEINFKPIGIGPFKLESYTRQQQIVLSKNDSTNFDHIPLIDKVIFKVVPDYSSRINQLKNGEVDIVPSIRPDDAELLAKRFENITISSISGRDYDYIGWNNIDGETFSKTKGKVIKPHPIFGYKKIRTALTLAINRHEIMEGYFNNFAILAETQISPIFKNFINNELGHFPFNPDSAKKILIEEGWIDHDGDNIIDKNGIPFKIKLSIASGKPHREFAASIVKNYLEKIGISVQIVVLETAVFFQNLFERKLDAWIAGWTIPLYLDLQAFWGSNLKVNIFNVSGYQNSEIDKIFLELKHAKSFNERRELINKFQKIIYQDQPVTFLYWIDNIIGYNRRINNIQLNPVAFTNRIWEWYLSN